MYLQCVERGWGQWQGVVVGREDMDQCAMASCESVATLPSEQVHTLGMELL